MKKTIIVAFAALILSSCSITKMRYSRGFNISFRNNYQNSDSKPEEIKSKKVKPSPVLNDTLISSHASNEDFLNNSQKTSAEKTDVIDIALTDQTPLAKNTEVNSYSKTKIIQKIKDPIKSVFKKKTNHQTEQVKSGTMGLLGFIFVMVSLILGLIGIPFMGLLLILGFIFSAIGMQRDRMNRGWAIAGFIIGLLAIIASILAYLLLIAIFA